MWVPLSALLALVYRFFRCLLCRPEAPPLVLFAVGLWALSYCGQVRQLKVATWGLARSAWQWLSTGGIWRGGASKETEQDDEGSKNEEEKENWSHTWEFRSGNVAVFALQGRRDHMEDRYAIIHGRNTRGTPGTRPNHAIYAVFDGHGGESAAEFVQSRLPEMLQRRLDGDEPGDTAHAHGNPVERKGCFEKQEKEPEEIEKILREEILALDEQLVSKLSAVQDEAGTTCLVALHNGSLLTVANVGDSRAVLCDGSGRAVPLSHDHKPHQLRERKRIKKAGGFISYNGSWRVQGVLAMSRSLGDFPLKHLRVVTSDPDVATFDLATLQPRFVLLATDGLWDAFGSQEAVSFVTERLQEPHLGAKSIAMQAYYRGCPDNITVMVVQLPVIGCRSNGTATEAR
uniref:Protein phosphatase, Mg2+/Mn2+ dependent 1L n=1 Tax=Eptatretus burgeri TaxID=7764 RepID=A0A8C4QU25_EPTBU